MSAGAQKICWGLIAAASCLAAGCYCHNGSSTAMAIGNRELPVGISGPRIGTTDVAASGYSSTYQRYQLDRRKMARQQSEQNAALKALARDLPETGPVLPASAEKVANE